MTPQTVRSIEASSNETPRQAVLSTALQSKGRVGQMSNYECGHCNRTTKVTASSIQELSGIDKALCVKHGMNPSEMVKVECPRCSKVALVSKDRLPDSGGDRRWWQFWK